MSRFGAFLIFRNVKKFVTHSVHASREKYILFSCQSGTGRKKTERHMGMCFLPFSLLNGSKTFLPPFLLSNGVTSVALLFSLLYWPFPPLLLSSRKSPLSSSRRGKESCSLSWNTQLFLPFFLLPPSPSLSCRAEGKGSSFAHFPIGGGERIAG